MPTHLRGRTPNFLLLTDLLAPKSGPIVWALVYLWNEEVLVKRQLAMLLVSAFGSAIQPCLAHAANAASAERWSLAKIIARATERTPEIKALAKDIERAENLAGQAGKWENPEGSISYGPMTQSGLQGFAFDVSIKQSIPLFGQKAIAADVGEQTKKTVEAESKKQLLLIKHEVVRLAYRLAGLEEQAKHVTHRKEKINLIAEFLKTRPFASPAQAVEKSLLLNRLREIEEKFLEISSAREAAWRALNVFLGLESRIVPDAKWATKPALPDRESLLKLFESQNPDLEKQQSLIATASLEADQAAKKGFPEIRIGGTYDEQTADLPQKIYSGTIELSLPIFDRGGYAKQAALAQKEAATYRLEQKHRELLAQFEQSWAVLEQSKKRIELYPLALVVKLEAQMSKAEQNWKKGLVQVTAFLELENQVHDQASKVFDAQTAYITALSQVQILAGVDFETEDK